MKRVSPRQLRRLQAKMLGNLGLDVKELGRASRIVIELNGRTIIVENANVFEMRVENESIFQIVGGEVSEGGKIEEERYEPSSEDVMLVAAQAGVSEEEARSALIEANGDLAKAILLLKSKKA